MQILDPDINSDKFEALHTKEEDHNSISIKEKKNYGKLIPRYPISQAVRTIAISSLVIIGFAIALGSSMPTTSPDTESVAYHHHYMPPHKKLSIAYGADDHDGIMNSTSSYTPTPASLVALKDCIQKPSQQQT